MKIGNLRHRITVQTATKTPDSMGGGQKTWTDAFSCWAHVRPLNGERRYQAMQVKRELSHEIVMRYRSDITVYNRIVYNGRVFEIDSIYPDELNTMLTIVCSEVV
ncbi:phage head closure protein [Aeribacillus pallidus]|uniref:phage head closure protein n=1 Tax=Aeribacillus pallidus TaxID=33936 RepID=UPI003D1B1C38